MTVPDGTTDDRLLDGRLRLVQPARGHRVGTDALLLAAFAPAGEAVADIGAGVGAVGLALAVTGRAAQVRLVERDPLSADLARQNIALNGMAGRVAVVQADVFAPFRVLLEAGLPAGSQDVVVTNPPYAAPGRLSPDARRRAAHAIDGGDLAGWLRACARLLAEGGRLALVHRADALRAVLAAVPRGLGEVRLRLVHPKAGEHAVRLLLSARKGSRAPLAVLPPLVLHRPDGAFTPEAERVHRVGTGLSPL